MAASYPLTTAAAHAYCTCSLQDCKFTLWDTAPGATLSQASGAVRSSQTSWLPSMLEIQQKLWGLAGRAARSWLGTGSGPLV
jgi:hypothetical protein